MAGVVGFAKALAVACKDYPEDHLYISELKHYLATCLKHQIEGVLINSGRFSLHTILSVSFPRNEQSEGLLTYLDHRNISVSGAPLAVVAVRM